MSVNGWIDGKVLAILQAFGVELPGGDGDTLRTIAGQWDTMGNELTAMATAIDNAVKGIDPKSWSGAARQAFDQHWAQQKQTIDQVAANFHTVATGLRAYATEVDNINKSIIDICVQIAEMEIAGAALSVFTGFLSDVVANTAVAAKVAKVIDLVALFTSAAEKVADLLAEFAELGEETAETLKAFLTTAAKLGGGFVKSTLDSFVTNFVADSGSMMANQALSGQKVSVGTDLTNGAWDAGGTALFTGGASTLAAGAGVTGRIGSILNGEGGLGTTVHGALGNVVGGVTMDLVNGQSPTTTGEDALTNAATGAIGNSINHGAFKAMENHGSLGGENLSDRGKLTDAAFKDSFGTGVNTAVYTAGSGIEADIEQLADGE